MTREPGRKEIYMNNEEKILALLEKHDKLLEEMKTDISDLKSNQEIMRADISDLKSSQEEMRADISNLKSSQEEMRADISDLKSNQEIMRADLTKVMVTQENVVIPQLKTLAEGHMTLLETLAPKSRVEALEEDVSILKVAVKALTSEMAELKKAQ